MKKKNEGKKHEQNIDEDVQMSNKWEEKSPASLVIRE